MAKGGRENRPVRTSFKARSVAALMELLYVGELKVR